MCVYKSKVIKENIAPYLDNRTKNNNSIKHKFTNTFTEASEIYK